MQSLFRVFLTIKDSISVSGVASSPSSLNVNPRPSVLNQKFVYQFGDGAASGVGDANGSPGSEDRTVE